MPTPTARDTPRKPIPMSRAEFGRRVGRGRSSVTEACAGALAAACLPGGRIDAAHPGAAAWCAKRGIDPRVLRELGPLPVTPATKPVRAPKTVSSEPVSEPVADALLDLTLREITERFGSFQGFADYIDARKKIADTYARELKNADSRGLLISRAFVRTHVIGLIEATNRRLLSDTPKTLCRELYALAKSSAPIEDAERAARNLIGKQLESVKAKATKNLRRPSPSSKEPTRSTDVTDPDNE
jgi:hypothetical protein